MNETTLAISKCFLCDIWGKCSIVRYPKNERRNATDAARQWLAHNTILSTDKHVYLRFITCGSKSLVEYEYPTLGFCLGKLLREVDIL